MKRKYKGNMLVERMKRANSKRQFDTHCWKYYWVKFRMDYTVQNRSRINECKINER